MLGAGDESNASSPPGTQIFRLRSMNAVEYLRGLGARRLGLKIDVETFEFELLRGLIASGALCDTRRQARSTIYTAWPSSIASIHFWRDHRIGPNADEGGTPVHEGMALNSAPVLCRQTDILVERHSDY